MPPNEECPIYHVMIADWHVEWYKTEGPSLYRGLAALDCPCCRQPVGFQGGKIGLAGYWSPQEVQQADANQHAKQGGP